MDMSQKMEHIRRLFEPEPPTLETLIHLHELFDLTQTELRCIAYLATGYRLKQIARQIHCTENSVRTFMKHVYSKTMLHNQAQIVVMVHKVEKLYRENHA